MATAWIPDSESFSGNVLVDEVPAGTHDHAESLFRSVPCDIVHILAEQRFPAASTIDRRASCPDLVDDGECLMRGEHSVCFRFAAST